MYEQVENQKANKSSAVANTVAQKKSNGKQGFGFVDNRPESVTQGTLQVTALNSLRAKKTLQLQDQVRERSTLQRKPNFKMTLKDIEDNDLTIEKIQDFNDKVKKENSGKTSGKWNAKTDPNPGHTVGTMIDIEGNTYTGYSTLASAEQVEENQRHSTSNAQTLCAEQVILKEHGEKSLIFSVARDKDKNPKEACDKCASGHVLGKHNIVDSARENAVDNLFSLHDFRNLRIRYERFKEIKHLTSEEGLECWVKQSAPVVEHLKKQPKTAWEPGSVAWREELATIKTAGKWERIKELKAKFALKGPIESLDDFTRWEKLRDRPGNTTDERKVMDKIQPGLIVR